MIYLNIIGNLGEPTTGELLELVGYNFLMILILLPILYYFSMGKKKKGLFIRKGKAFYRLKDVLLQERSISTNQDEFTLSIPVNNNPGVGVKIMIILLVLLISIIPFFSFV